MIAIVDSSILEIADEETLTLFGITHRSRLLVDI